MASEKKACESMKTVTREVHEGEEKPPHLPHPLVKKLLRVVNRELVGWELDRQTEVSKGLTS